MSDAIDQRDTLYRRYAPAAYRRAHHLLGSEADADEVVHDVFLSLFERPEQQRAATSIAGYFYGAVTHACLNRLRNQRTRARLALQHHADAVLPFDPGTGPESSLAARVVLANLPEPLAEVAVYYYVDELTQREIAEILGCSPRHVGNHLERLSRWAAQQEKQACQR